MKKLIFVLLFLFVASIVYADDCKIFKIKGSVQLRAGVEEPWMDAREGQNLKMGYEIVTQKKSECIFGFGKNIEGALTLKENSQMKITQENIRKLELMKGRIFSLIEKKERGSQFEIKTPAAIAGVRGTGWTVSSQKKTSVKCFEGEVYVKGLDENGNVIAEQDVPEGTGVNVSQSGEVGKSQKLSKKDKKEWKNFSDIVRDFIGKPIGKAVGVIGSVSEGAVDGYLGKDSDNPFNR